jgi:hypothetical protein
VEVWQLPDDSWRWRFVGVDGEGEQVELPSNELESSREEAVSAAQVAYPGLPVEVLDSRKGGETEPGPAGRLSRWPWAVLVALAGVLVAAVGVRFRRWRTALVGTATVAAAVERVRRRRASG